MSAKPSDTGKYPETRAIITYGARETVAEITRPRSIERRQFPMALPPRAVGGACLAVVITVLISALGPGSNRSGKEASSTADLTPLQRHVAFFDRNKDGVIYPSETYQGFRAIGAGVPLSAAAAAFINGLLGPKTIPKNEKVGPFKFPIYVSNIHKGKHGSDSGVYDVNGRFVPEKFEEIFKKHAHTRPDALTAKELQELLQANREPKDLAGWLGGFTEWKVLYALCKDKDGFLNKDTIKAVYDVSLFEKMEQDTKAKESAKKK